VNWKLPVAFIYALQDRSELVSLEVDFYAQITG